MTTKAKRTAVQILKGVGAVAVLLVFLTDANLTGAIMPDGSVHK